MRARKVRELGDALPGAEIEAVLVDDELGFVYYVEENPRPPQVGRTIDGRQT